MGARGRLARAACCAALAAAACAAQGSGYLSADECLFCHGVKIADAWQENPHGRTIWTGDNGRTFIGSSDAHAREVKKIRYGVFALRAADGSGWDNSKFALRCAGCHTSGIDPQAHPFTVAGISCDRCHGAVPREHTGDKKLVRFSSLYPKDPKEVISVCGQCHLRGGRSKSTGLPYPAGADLLADFAVDLNQADNAALNAGDRHVYMNVRDVLQNGSAVTCLNCHRIHAGGTARHRFVLTSAICLNCHNESGPKKAVKTYVVHSAVCEY
jgi:hypothetical protein